MLSNAGNAIRPLHTQIGRVLARYSIWFVGLCLIYSVLLVIGCAVPQSAVEANRQQSIRFLDEEGLKYKPLYGNTRMDNFSDLLMLRGCAESRGGRYSAPSAFIHAIGTVGSY